MLGMNLRPRLQLRRAGCQSRGEFEGKKYLRGGIPGTGLYYQSSLPDAQPGQQLQRTASVSPFAIIIMMLVIGLIIFAMSSSNSTKMTAPVAPVPQIVAPVAAPVVHKHAGKKHKRRHVAHGAPATTTKPDEAPAAESANPDVNGEGEAPSR